MLAPPGRRVADEDFVGEAELVLSAKFELCLKEGRVECNFLVEWSGYGDNEAFAEIVALARCDVNAVESLLDEPYGGVEDD